LQILEISKIPYQWYYFGISSKETFMSYLIGIDGGGTSCRAVIAKPDGSRLGEGRAGPANIVTDVQDALRNIESASGQAAKQAGLSRAELEESSAVLGLAGANIASRGAVFEQQLRFLQSRVVSDARIALAGALGDNDGAVAIVGTGSVFIAQHRGAIRSIGGWGFAVGDFCSGARLGRTLLQEVLLAHDKVRPRSALTDAVMNRFSGSPDELVEYAQSAKPREFGIFAPLLFDAAYADDPIAAQIVDLALEQLEENLRVLIDRDNLPFCLLGGLASIYSSRLKSKLKKRELEPKGNALQGAVTMAVNAFGRRQKEPHRDG
jgi:glucosamine kinase